MVESNDETLEHLLQGLLSHFSCVESNRFSELISRNSRAFLQEQKSDIYALYGISCYLGQISPEVSTNQILFNIFPFNGLWVCVCDKMIEFYIWRQFLLSDFDLNSYIKKLQYVSEIS